MFRRLPGYIFVFLFFVFVFLVAKIENTKAAAGGNQPCGNGVCQASQGENSNTCPADCGAVTTPTPTPNPTLTPAPTSTPNPTTNPTTGPTDNPSSTNGPSPTDNSTGSTNNTTQDTTHSIALVSYPSSVTNGDVVSFSGVSSGVDSVEYRINSGDWLTASGASNFSFSFSNLSDGSYLVEVRGKYGGNYTGSTNTNFTLVNTAPTLTVNIPTDPSANTNLEITGTFSSALPVTVQVSLDGGSTWLPTTINGNRFSSLLPEFEDGNFEILVRAIDSLGNTTISDPKTLIIDTLPPILGTQIVTSGPIIISPESAKDYQIVSGTPFEFVVSFLGGPTKVVATVDGKQFDLEKIGSSNLWRGEILLDNPGEFEITVDAVDGANNTLTKSAGFLKALNQGKINATDEVELTLYTLDVESNSWIIWDGPTYDQKNPKKVKDQYSFFAPSGTYYLEATANGYQTSQSKIFTLNKPSLINFGIPMEKITGINFLKYIFPNYFDVNVGANTRLDESGSFELPEDIEIQNGVLVLMDTWSPSSFEQALAINNLSESEKQNLTVYFVQATDQKAKSFVRRGKYTFNHQTDKTGETLNSIYANSPTFYKIEDSKVVKKYQGFLSTQRIVDEFINLK